MFTHSNFEIEKQIKYNHNSNSNVLEEQTTSEEKRKMATSGKRKK